ncbi:hypothetical protein CFC21_081838 [Triticum aestivum]|uniref:Peroxidase n=2 Tax=Triticum aestivum TaxID=4565 RepID=A0A9R1I5L1_WHEAT|nr:hypothetical protein CFC21_081838 [Triticum aestivum]
MASSSTCRAWHCLLALFLLSSSAYGQLSPSFYAKTCPTLELIVRSTVTKAILVERRMGASLLRLHFHDCFVQGSFVGEKTALPNMNSVRGFGVIDEIKKNVELVCPGVVSCADIIAVAARDGVVLLGGPSWPVPLGQRDSTTASLNAANSDIPTPDYSLDQLIAAFNKHQLSPRDMTALSGAHTIGYSQCINFRDHIYNGTNIDPVFATLRKRTCPAQAPNGDTNLAPLDVQTPLAFDNAYYSNLVAKRGLLNSDQELFNGGSQDALVSRYVINPALFASDFVTAIIKMSKLSPPPGTPTQIRRNCRVINS